MKDHIEEKNADWGLVFLEIEKRRLPIPWSAQVMSLLFDEGLNVQVDFKWVSNALWTFIGKHISDTLYNNRNSMAGGGENGIELWRAFFVKHEGCADQVELGGIGSLHEIPKCETSDKLHLWIGQ